MNASTSRTGTADEHFARLGAGYDNEAFTGAGLQWVSTRELDAVRRSLAGTPARARVLDAGAGNGRVTRVLGSELGFDVTALDAVPAMLATIKRSIPETKTVVAHLGEPLPFETASFDAVVSLRVLKWVPAWEYALSELVRVLRPDGRIVIEITNRNSLARFGYRNAPVKPVARRAVREVGERAGVCWTTEIPGTHLPFALWQFGNRHGVLRAVTAIQRGADLVLGTTAARSIVLAGYKLPAPVVD